MDKPEVEIRYEYNEKDKCFRLSEKLPVWPSDVPCEFSADAHGDIRLSKRYIPVPVAMEIHNLDDKMTLRMSVSGEPFNPFEGEPSSIEVSRQPWRQTQPCPPNVSAIDSGRTAHQRYVRE